MSLQNIDIIGTFDQLSLNQKISLLDELDFELSKYRYHYYTTILNECTPLREDGNYQDSIEYGESLNDVMKIMSYNWNNSKSEDKEEDPSLRFLIRVLPEKFLPEEFARNFEKQEILTPESLYDILYEKGNLEDFEEEWDGDDFQGRIFPINFEVSARYIRSGFEQIKIKK